MLFFIIVIIKLSEMPTLNKTYIDKLVNLANLRSRCKNKIKKDSELTNVE